MAVKAKVFLVIGLVLAIAAQVLFYLHPQNIWGELFTAPVVLGSGLFIVAMALWFLGGDASGFHPAPRNYRPPLLLAAILAVAAYMRFEALGSIPDDLSSDMAAYGNLAREYLSGAETRIFSTVTNSQITTIPRVGLLPTVTGMKLGGNNMRGLMTAAAVEGLLSLLALYGLVLLLFESEGLALMATAIMAGNAAHIHYSRIAVYMDPWPWCLGALFFLIHGFKRGRCLSFVVGGFLLGVGLQMYSSGRVMVLVIVALFLHLLVVKRDWLRSSEAGIYLFGLTALIPNLYLIRHFEGLSERWHQIWLFNPGVMTHLTGKYHLTSPFAVLLRQTGLSLLTFNYTIDDSPQFGFHHPMFYPLMAPFVLLGAAVALRRWREPGPAFALLFFSLTLTLGSILTVDAPYWPHLVGILVPTSIFAALAFQMLGSVLPRGVAQAMVAAFLIWITVSSYVLYRREFSQNGRTYTNLGRFINALPKDAVVCSVGFGVPPELAFLAWPRHVVSAKVGVIVQGCSIWIVRPDDTSTVDLLKNRWPNGVLEEHWNRGDLVQRRSRPEFDSFTAVGQN
jgi:Dolichyl-phosphate-mannose-protein mannosyltransferase